MINVVIEWDPAEDSELDAAKAYARATRQNVNSECRPGINTTILERAYDEVSEVPR